ncbi:hypothetical protein VTI74DRAFT_4532 [Chaetomium olivicolor]
MSCPVLPLAVKSPLIALCLPNGLQSRFLRERLWSRSCANLRMSCLGEAGVGQSAMVMRRARNQEPVLTHTLKAGVGRDDSHDVSQISGASAEQAQLTETSRLWRVAQENSCIEPAARTSTSEGCDGNIDKPSSPWTWCPPHTDTSPFVQQPHVPCYQGWPLTIPIPSRIPSPDWQEHRVCYTTSWLK